MVRKICRVQWVGFCQALRNTVTVRCTRSGVQKLFGTWSCLWRLLFHEPLGEAAAKCRGIKKFGNSYKQGRLTSLFSGAEFGDSLPPIISCWYCYCSFYLKMIGIILFGKGCSESQNFNSPNLVWIRTRNWLKLFPKIQSAARRSNQALASVAGSKSNFATLYCRDLCWPSTLVHTLQVDILHHFMVNIVEVPRKHKILHQLGWINQFANHRQGSICESLSQYTWLVIFLIYPVSSHLISGYVSYITKIIIEYTIIGIINPYRVFNGFLITDDISRRSARMLRPRGGGLHLWKTWSPKYSGCRVTMVFGVLTGLPTWRPRKRKDAVFSRLLDCNLACWNRNSDWNRHVDPVMP